MSRKISDMVVVITGASAGIGRALAEQLSRQGAMLVLAARRIDKLEDLNRVLGGRHLTIACDVSSPADCQRLIEQAIERLGRIDTLVCNAGYGIVKTVAETTHDEMLRIFKTNVFGTTDCIHAAVPHIRKQEPRDGWRGQIMIVSSAAARRGLPYFGAYSATKFAQLGLSEALRVELKPYRIAVTSVHPIGTDTDFFATAETGTGLKMPPAGRGEVRQPSEIVARRMVETIELPRPELWPMPLARYALSLSTVFPGITDRIMAKYRGDIGRQNAGNG
jgi:NAD(P)-dependent dehydrogenase (short-subunit alcohol dehydrogenase family)